MLRKDMTVADAAREWVREFNAIPQGMLEQLRNADPDSWHEITVPTRGNRVYVYSPRDLGASGDTYEGVIERIYRKEPRFSVKLDDGKTVLCGESDFDVTYDGALPMWGTMWSFGENMDDDWLTQEGLAKMSACGFRVYEHDEWGFFFGIDGAGYDFYEAHWIPLYHARGLEWHDPKAEKEFQMKKKGYRRGKLGGKEVWLDTHGNVIEEVS